MLETVRTVVGDNDVILGESPYRYRPDTQWAKLPRGWTMGDVGSVAVDKQDNVYVFNRSEHPMMVFDRKGNFLTSWGEGVFKRPHAVHMGPDDTIYCTDDGDHAVRRCTLEGKVLLTLGIPGSPQPPMSGRPFNRCTHTALSPENDIYVSDGYGNARVHKFSPEGKLITSWGAPGTDPGQFNVVHNVCCDAEGWVYVADRENHRVQIFNGDGKYETQWNNLHRPNGLCLHGTTEQHVYIAEGGPQMRINLNTPNLGARVSIVTKAGKPLARLGDVEMGLEPGRFIAPHGLCVDSHGDIYVGEVTRTSWKGKWPDREIPADVRVLTKLVKI